MSVPRRIVTGHDDQGRSVVLSDGPTPETHENEFAVFHELWNTKATPAPVAPVEPEPTERPLITPPDPNGTIVRITVIKAGEESPMHRTESIDYGIVLEGEIWLVLDDGSETRLGPGRRGDPARHRPRVGEPLRRAGADRVHPRRRHLHRRAAHAIGSPELWDHPLDA